MGFLASWGIRGEDLESTDWDEEEGSEDDDEDDEDEEDERSGDDGLARR